MATHERVVQEFSNGLIELHRIIRKCLKDRAEIGSTLGDKFFRDSIGMQKGTEAQQFGSSRVFLFDLLKRERPRSSHGFRMICGSLAPAPVQLFPLQLVEL